MSQFEGLGFVWCRSWANREEWHLQTKLGSKTLLSILILAATSTGILYRIKSLGCVLDVHSKDTPEVKSRAIEWFRELLAGLQKIDPTDGV